MSKKRILIQLDSDAHASVFDGVVAVDSDVEKLFQYGNVEPSQVRDLVHGAMFTRGPQDLCSTAIFVGGSDVSTGDELMRQVTSSFFGPMRVSVMMDANGANTTAAAAVLAAARHVNLAEITAVVLAGTGPVGQRAARLLARQGAKVRVASRKQGRATSACAAIAEVVDGGELIPVQTANDRETETACEGADVVIAAGAAGIQLLEKETRLANQTLKVVVDLNAVPPLGIEGTEVIDKGQERDGVICYGAIGVGGTKMKIHKEAIRRLFRSNDQVLDAEEIYAIGSELEG